jgi:hypothetical protein
VTRVAPSWPLGGGASSAARQRCGQLLRGNDAGSCCAATVRAVDARQRCGQLMLGNGADPDHPDSPEEA